MGQQLPAGVCTFGMNPREHVVFGAEQLRALQTVGKNIKCCVTAC